MMRPDYPTQRFFSFFPKVSSYQDVADYYERDQISRVLSRQCVNLQTPKKGDHPSYLFPPKMKGFGVTALSSGEKYRKFCDAVLAVYGNHLRHLSTINHADLLGMVEMYCVIPRIVDYKGYELLPLSLRITVELLTFIRVEMLRRIDKVSLQFVRRYIETATPAMLLHDFSGRFAPFFDTPPPQRHMLLYLEYVKELRGLAIFDPTFVLRNAEEGRFAQQTTGDRLRCIRRDLLSLVSRLPTEFGYDELLLLLDGWLPQVVERPGTSDSGIPRAPGAAYIGSLTQIQQQCADVVGCRNTGRRVFRDCLVIIEMWEELLGSAQSCGHSYLPHSAFSSLRPPRAPRGGGSQREDVEHNVEPRARSPPKRAQSYRHSPYRDLDGSRSPGERRGRSRNLAM